MKKIILWHLLIIWCGIIFLFSNQSAGDSSYLSTRIAIFLETVLTALKNISVPVFKPLAEINFELLAENLELIVRKMAHFFVFFVLGIISASLSSCYTQKKSANFFLPLLFCVLYAISDEIHQLYVPGRYGRISDVFIDSSGSFFGIFISGKFLKIKRG